MSQEMGYQHGIVAGMNGLRDLDPSKTLLKKTGGKWPSIDTLKDVPLDQWKAWDKMERAFTILVQDHDAALAGGAPPDPKPPDPPPVHSGRYAPRTHNLGSHDQDPRFCMRSEYGVTRVGNGYVDEMGCRYDENGMSVDGLRDRGYMVEGIRGADDMNSLEPCDAYIGPTGHPVPPYPGDPILQTGSYHR